MGRVKGRLDCQQKTWKANKHVIVKSLMDKWPSFVAVGELEKLTDLTRDTLYKHLDEMENSALAVKQLKRLRGFPVDDGFADYLELRKWPGKRSP